MEQQSWAQQLRSGGTELGNVDEYRELLRAAAGPASSSAVAPSDVRLDLVPADDPGGPGIACTLDGGAEAMQARVDDWQEIVRRATDRHPVAGGVTLTYEPDQQLAADLARLAAAEYACCSFFTFTLTLGPTGIALTIAAPEEVKDVVAAMFGAYGPPLAGQP